MYAYLKSSLKIALSLILGAAGLCCLSSCGGDDEPAEKTQPVPGAIQNGCPATLSECYSEITGTWYCTMQYWREFDDTTGAWDEWSEEYQPSADMSGKFNSDQTGYFRSRNTSIFEQDHGDNFTWSIVKEGNSYILHTRRTYYDYDTNYQIVSLKNNVLELLWDDDDLKILCRFTRH